MSESNFNTYATARLKSRGFSKAERRAFWRFVSGDWTPPDPFPKEWRALMDELRADFDNQKPQSFTE